jgi:hypothetical protein
MADYIPSRESLLSAWATNFSDLITATPGAYGLMASDATTISNAVALFTAALSIALNPTTKTKASVADKDAKKAAMLVTIRQYAKVIKLNLGVSNEAKIGLGLTINDSGRTPVPAPTTEPVISVASGAPLQQILRFVDATTPDRRARPAGVTGMMLVRSIGTAEPTDIDSLPIYGIATRQPYVVNFDLADKAKTAYYFGRWVTATGLVGPWSQSAALTIAG